MKYTAVGEAWHRKVTSSTTRACSCENNKQFETVWLIAGVYDSWWNALKIKLPVKPVWVSKEFM